MKHALLAALPSVSKSKKFMVRMTEKEKLVLAQKADEYTAGNMSEYVRHAILRWQPELSDHEKTMAELVSKDDESPEDCAKD